MHAAGPLGGASSSSNSKSTCSSSKKGTSSWAPNEAILKEVKNVRDKVEKSTIMIMSAIKRQGRKDDDRSDSSDFLDESSIRRAEEPKSFVSTEEVCPYADQESDYGDDIGDPHGAARYHMH